MQTGEIDARAIVSEDFRIRFAGDSTPEADGIRGPIALQSLVAASRANQSGVSFISAGDPIANSDGVEDSTSGQVASRWNRRVGNEAAGGMDILAFVDGRIVMAWSVTGKRAWLDERRED